MRNPRLIQGYVAVWRVDLRVNRRLAVQINALGVMVAVVMLLPALLRAGAFDLGGADAAERTLLWACLLAAVALLVLALKLVRNILARRFAARRIPCPGGMALPKRLYLAAGLLPAAGFAAGFAALLAVTHGFWFIYTLLVVDVSGAAGMMAAAILLMRFPADVVVGDDGREMVVYARA